MNKDWKNKAKSYSENNLFGNWIRTYYDENNEIVFCESSNVKNDELLKSLKKLSAGELNTSSKKQIRKPKGQNKETNKRRNEIKQFKKQLKKKNS